MVTNTKTIKLREIVYIPNKKKLIALNKIAQKHANRWIEDLDLKGLEEDACFPIAYTHFHNDCEMRCQVVLKKDGTTGWLDITLAEWEVLPVIYRSPTCTD